MYDIWAMNADGTNQRAITTNAGVLGRAAVSPDGGSIAYARLVSGMISGIVVRNLSSGMERTVSMENDSEPSWSHDGSQLAITSLRSGNPEIYVIDATSGAMVSTPAPDPALDGTPVFSAAP
jgi:TolB protein